MAGAGVVAEKLDPISVAKTLTQGGRFLKWDDQDVGVTAIFRVQVDPKGHVLYWKPEDYSKDTEVLEVVNIRDVRTGPSAKLPKDTRMRETLRTSCGCDDEGLLDRTISVCFGPNMVDIVCVNFVTQSRQEAQEWTKALFAITHNLLEQNASALKCLERFHTRMSVLTNQDGDLPAKTLVRQFSITKDDKKRAYDALQSVGLASGKRDIIKIADFTFDKFIEFYNRLCTRQDLDNIFRELGAKNRPYLPTEQLVEFLNNSQRDPRLNEILYPYFNTSRAQEIINRYEPNKDFAMKGYFSVDGLTKYLMSEDNLIISPERLSIHQNMEAPLSHYFINSSHNTYLTGHQLTGKSSVEIYRQVLLSGCRCIELDCWDGKTEEQEPIITHGMTLCTEVPFKEVVEAIAECAFKTSDFPVILSFENHCSPKQQLKMASYCVAIFGDMLLNKPLDDYPLESGKPLPSPKGLKRKILIKNKKRAAKVPSGDAEHRPSIASDPMSPLPDSTDANDNNLGKSFEEEGQDESVPKDEKEIIAIKEDTDEDPEVEAEVELSELVNYIQPVHFPGFEEAEKRKHFYEMSSFSENSATNLLKESPVEFVNYNKYQLSRIYPKGSRVSSDNYMPQVFWNAGCQLVALNFQTLDLPMMLNLGKFEYNGNCGYLLKPDFMCRSDRTFDPFAESTVDGIIAGTVHVKVISGQCLTDKKTGTYVEVEMYGLPADTVRRKFKTKVIQNNGINPVYDEEPFVFKKVILPSLACLRIAAYEENGKLIGHRILPVDGLSPGYRHIKLRNDSYMPLCLPTLFVHIVTKDYVPSSFADFADALANPIQYLSEKEKRAQQLTLLMIDENQDEVEQEPSQVLPSDLKVPNVKSQGKRGSIGIISIPSFGIGSQDKQDSSPSAKPLTKSQSAMFTRNMDGPDSLPSNRTRSLQPVKSHIIENKFPRSQSSCPEQIKSIREGSVILRSHSVCAPMDARGPTLDRELFELRAPSPEELRTHKVFIKVKMKFDGEMNVLLQKQAKERYKVNRELDCQVRKLKTGLEKEKCAIQKKHNKFLKKAEKDGNYEDCYQKCLGEINDLNSKHDKEVQGMLVKHREQLKSLLKNLFQEQLSLAKTQVEPEYLELKRIAEAQQVIDVKRLQERHNREMHVLKKDQDRFNRGELKLLSREYRDKGELQRMKREQNKKHIEQSVKERQKMKEFQQKEEEDFVKQYEELFAKLIQERDKIPEELDKRYEAKCIELETRDLSEVSAALLEGFSSPNVTSSRVISSS